MYHNAVCVQRQLDEGLALDWIRDKTRSRLSLSYGVSIALFWAAQHIYVPFLPVYAKAEGATLSLVGAIVASYSLVQALLRLPLGVVAERVGLTGMFAVTGFVGMLAVILALLSIPGRQFGDLP